MEKHAGEKASKWYYFVDRPFRIFTFFRDRDGRLKWRKSEKSKIENINRTQPAEESKEKRKGCGKSITWSEMCSVEEKVILELFDVATIDQANELVNQMINKESSASFSKMYDVHFLE